MEWLAKNAKKLGGVTVVALMLTAGIVSMIPGCEGGVSGLLDAKKAVETVEPLLPGDALPEGAR
jgi:hypothetical protein